MTAPLPLCVIGGGAIGLRHVEVIAAAEPTRLTAVVEPAAARRAELAGRGLPVAATLDEVPAETRAAVVATPTPDHPVSGRAALSRGWAVLVEKPVAGTLDAARTLARAATEAGLPLIVGHHRRCHPFAQSARDVLADLGAPVGAQGIWSLRKPDAYFDVDWRRLPGAGPLMTNLSHEIDLLRFLMGDIVEVSALRSNARRGLAVEDTASLALRFASGALGSFLISDAGASPWAFEAASGENPAIARSGEDYLRIVGTRGALAFPSLTRFGGDGTVTPDWAQALARDTGPKLARVDPLQAQIDRFAALVGGGVDNVLCTAADGIAALEMTLAAGLSADRGAPVAAGAVPGGYDGTRE